MFFAAIFLCVAAAHVWMIWMAPTAFTFSPEHVHTDNAVMLLMGKHILEKGEFPIFYYGQNWFGSLSAVVHAGVFLALGGIPPWSIHVAPLLFFLGFCLVLYLLTRMTLGPAVALVALAWNIVTPVPLSEYTVMPHGGYIEGLMLGTLLLWLAVRLVRAREPWKKTVHYALLGFAGGVGWWTSPLVVYQILAAAAYVVMRERLSAVWKGAVLSLPAFFIGAAPFFYFYARDPYSDVLKHGRRVRAAQCTRRPVPAVRRAAAAVPRLGPFPGGRPRHALARRARLRLGPGLLPVAPPRIIRRAASLERRRHLPDLLPRLHAPVRRKHPHPAKRSEYAIPLSALLPVAIGFWLWYSRRAWKLAAWVGCAALFLVHGWETVSWVVADAPRAEASTQGHVTLVHDLEARGVTRLYLHLAARIGASQLLRARAHHCVTDDRREVSSLLRGLGTGARSRLPLSPGNRGLVPTLKVLGASYEIEPLGDYDLVRHVRPTDRRYRQVSVDRLHASASHGSDAMRYAVDRDMESRGRVSSCGSPECGCSSTWASQSNVGMVRLWNRGEDHGTYAMDIRVETSVDGRAWHEAVPRSPMELLYWSGPRLYPWEWGYRWETRFPPVDARFVRITQHEQDPRFPWVIAEAYVYEDLGPGAGADAGEQDVLRRIRDLGLGRVYADRWMSAGIAESSTRPDRDGHALHHRRAGILRAPEHPGDRVGRADRIRPGGRRCGRVRAHDEGGRHSPSVPRGPRAVGAVPWQGPLGARRRARGRSRMVVERAGRRAHRSGEKSRYLATLAQNADRDGSTARALLRPGRPWRPTRPITTRGASLIHALESSGRTAEAAEQSRILRDSTEPQVKTALEFQDTLELRGYTLGPEPARPGRDVKIRFFWKVKRDPGPPGAIGVFVHVRNATGRFQGDFHFLPRRGGPIWPTLEDEIFTQDELIRVPAHASPGTYKVRLGVYDSTTGDRWKVTAGEGASRRGGAPVGVLRVEPNEAR